MVTKALDAMPTPSSDKNRKRSDLFLNFSAWPEHRTGQQVATEDQAEEVLRGQARPCPHPDPS